MPSSKRSGTASVEGSSLSGCSVSRKAGVGGEHAAVRPEELVGRAEEDVGAERGHVDGGVRGEVHPVDHAQRPLETPGAAPAPGRVDGRGDRRDRRTGPDEVGRPRDRDDPRALGEHRGDVVDAELGRRRVEVDPPHRRARPLRREHPGTDVRVVVEAGDDDLVARPPGRGEGVRQVDGQRRHAPPEHDPAGVGAEQVGHRPAGRDDDVVREALRRREAAAVRDRRGQRRRHGLRDLEGDLRAARPVEVRVAGRQGREAGAERGDVVGHRSILTFTRCGHPAVSR